MSEDLLKKAVEQFFLQMEGENGRSDPKYAPTYGVIIPCTSPPRREQVVQQEMGLSSMWAGKITLLAP